MSETLKELESKLYFIDDRLERINIAERAIILAENEKKFKAAYDLRSGLIEDATFGGRPLKALVAFAQNLKYAEEHKDDIYWGGLLWSYKWVISSATKFHQVSYEKIFELLDDFKRRITELGDNLSAYYTMRYAIAENMGEKEDLIKFHALQRDTPSGRFNNCHACVIDDHVSYKAKAEGFDAAEREAVDIISGELSCGSVPQATFASLIESALFEKNIEGSALYCKKMFPMIKNDEDFIGDFGWHFITWAIQGKTAEAFDLFKKSYKKINNPANSGIGFYEYHIGACILFQNISQKEDTVVLPFEIKGICAKGKSIATKNVANFLEKILDEQAMLFDNRNRNHSFKDKATHFKNLYYI